MSRSMYLEMFNGLVYTMAELDADQAAACNAAPDAKHVVPAEWHDLDTVRIGDRYDPNTHTFSTPELTAADKDAALQALAETVRHVRREIREAELEAEDEKLAMRMRAQKLAELEAWAEKTRSQISAAKTRWDAECLHLGLGDGRFLTNALRGPWHAERQALILAARETEYAIAVATEKAAKERDLLKAAQSARVRNLKGM